MAANKIIRIGPVALTTTLTTNILNPAITALAGPIGFTMTQPYIIIRHMRVVNKTASAAKFSFWLGATGANAAGTEEFGTNKSVPANDAYDWYGVLKMNSADFLVGGSDTATALTVTFEVEIGVS